MVKMREEFRRRRTKYFRVLRPGFVSGIDPAEEAVYPRRETAICICLSSGGGKFEYIN
jgi:hypothetical protein